MYSGDITDKQLVASSHYSASTLAKYARLNQSMSFGAWCPNQTKNWYPHIDSGPHYDQYLQVNLLQPFRITGIGTQGSGGPERLTAFHVNYTLSKPQWKEVYDYRTGHVKVSWRHLDMQFYFSCLGHCRFYTLCLFALKQETQVLGNLNWVFSKKVQ